jgi:hypothetical protein
MDFRCQISDVRSWIYLGRRILEFFDFWVLGDGFGFWVLVFVFCFSLWNPKALDA